MNTKPKSAPSATTFEAQLDVALIHKHPKNPRHKAVADQELIDSVKATGLVQALVVAPHPTRDGDYVLIAGHRRLDACRKNRYKTVPAIIRHDLVDEAKQLEAMLIENGRRKDLSPIEEAEGYQQLALFSGYTQKRVAQTVGVDPKTVSSRLKLLKLAKTTQTKVHEGQVGIDDALAIASFADNPSVTKSLEKAIGTSNFRWELERAKTARKRGVEVAKEIAELKALGATEHVLPKGTNDTWSYFRQTDTPEKLESFNGHLEQPAAHDNCLGYVHVDKGTQWEKAFPVCLHPGSHGQAIDEDEAARREATERSNREREEIKAAHAAASNVRVASVLGLIENKPLPKGLEQLVRVALPYLVSLLDDKDEQARFFEILNVPPDARWTPFTYQRKPKDIDRLEAYYLTIAHHADNVLPRILAAFLVTKFEGIVEPPFYNETKSLGALRYLELLQDIGHPFSDVDRELMHQAGGQSDDTTEAEAS